MSSLNEPPTDEELEVAAILCDLPNDSRSSLSLLAGMPNWGTKKPRTVCHKSPSNLSFLAGARRRPALVVTNRLLLSLPLLLFQSTIRRPTRGGGARGAGGRGDDCGAALPQPHDNMVTA
ncbi:hypothetical protein MUK42_37028 [Musa troglodytarum]|uniref:Uncharacterized protein n=1 Tax=Musa troglodytarum TaxID=320322 RepID=A0A9E7J8T4_9LILI|nr:hypothetical protein MUK42_37028 [Musa troglodytarum]